MNIYYVEIADYAQSMLPNMKKEIYNFYKEMIPKNKTYLKYVKSQTKGYSKDLLEKVADYYEVGIREARSYIAVMKKDELTQILSEMGLEDKEIKKLLKWKKVKL